jgi:phosphoribosyl 1,2-cyclic phosphate phosphodiesterase
LTIRLLGTGAADGIPGFYATDRVSRHARAHGGKDARTRSAALVDGVLKIDLPPDTLCQLHRDRLDARDWTALVFTHSHEDHFAVSEIQYALYPFTELEQLPFQIYGNETVRGIITDRYPDWPIDFITFRGFSPREVAGYKVTPLPAHHQPAEACFNLLIERDRTLLYATDTGVWDEPTFEFLTSKRLDCLVIECTEGFRDSGYDGHLNLETLAGVLSRLRATGTVTPSTQVITTHHAATGNGTHAELEAALAPLGARPGFDGMVITF